MNLFFRQPRTPLRVVLQEMPQRHKQFRSMSHSPLVQGLVMSSMIMVLMISPP